MIKCDMRYLLFFILISSIQITWGQDSLSLKSQLLDEVSVSALGSKEPIIKTIGSVSYIQIDDQASTSLFSPMNTIPGVQFEERSPGSYRLNIRGSSLRAPFDVRNVKIYWNGIPITEPGGNTPLNIFNIADLRQSTIIRGPASSKY